MAIRSHDRGVTWRLIGRPLVSIAVAYALILQVFAAAIGYQAAVTNSDLQFASELCAHDSAGSPMAPGGVPDRACLEHCLFCCASIGVGLTPPQSAELRGGAIKVALVAWPIEAPYLPQPPQYALARPRGPPLSV